MSRPIPRFVFALAAALGVQGLASAQSEAPPTLNVPHTYDTGFVENDTATTRVVASFTVQDPLANWMRLYFDEVQLAGDSLTGNGAYLRITSHIDGGVQELNARHLREWQNSTAYFNGDAVQVEIVSPPDIGPSRLVMRSVDMGLPYPSEPSICGNLDDRVLSQDPRSARILPVGCTGWIINDCANCFLTAGHCTGNISVAQFNVPLSNGNGSLNQPGPDDQYAIDASSLQSNGGQGVGNDWAYFGAFANSNTNLTPFQAQGDAFELVSQPGSPNGQTIRITGYGTDSDDPTHNQVQQTHTGPMVTSTNTTVQYATDTTGGNSGSPVIWEETGQAVGIHTHGGCSAGGGQNSGTASSNSGLTAALASPQGLCASGVVSPVDPPSVEAPGSAPTLTVQIVGTPQAGVFCEYRADGGPFQTLAMTHLGSNVYEVDLPSLACSDQPQYYFRYDDANCGPVLSPDGAPGEFFSFLVGVENVLFADDFELDTGWTTVVNGATTGDWQRGVPVNDPNWAYDPTSDSDGSGSCYLTQNTLGNSDVDAGTVRLISPEFDLSQGGLITYDYFFNITGDDPLQVHVRSSSSASWVSVTTYTSGNGLTWTSDSIDSTQLTALGVTLTDTMQVRFSASDNDPQSIVEAGVDAFRVVQVDCSGIGTNYCVAAPNSAGSGAIIRAEGSESVSANDLMLVAGPVPNQPGIFYYGPDQVLLPFGDGFRCVGGIVGRLAPVAGSGNLISTMVDNTTPPNANTQITVGSTWNFQAWFRDPSAGLTGFNLSDGLEITFQP